MKNKTNYIVEKHQIKRSNPLWLECDTLCYKAKNLYNQGLYRVRQYYIENKKYLNYSALQGQIQKEKIDCYTALNAKNAQLVLKDIDHDFKTFFASLKEYRKHPEKFKKRPGLPHYLDKKGRHTLTFNIQTVSKPELEKGFLKLSGTSFSLPIQNKVSLLDKKFKGKDIRVLSLKEVRIVPKNDVYEIEIVHVAPEMKEKPKLYKDRYAALDLGLNNIGAVITNIKGTKNILFNGKPIKSINHFYNKRQAEIRSQIDLSKSRREVKRLRKNLHKLERIRRNKIRDYMHKTSSTLINYLVSLGVSTLVIGRNPDWKQEINIGGKNNQNFCFIPHYSFIQMCMYKGLRIGMKVIDHEESYTSKCSFLDFEEISKHEVYLGRRVKRGLFKSHKRYLINADINGSCNILRKVVSNAFDHWSEEELIEGFVVSPVCLTIDNPQFKEDLSRIYRQAKCL